MFDYPHLLKCLRNNLITKDLLFTWKGKKGKASWTHLERAFTIDKYGGMFRLFRKLSEANIHPNNKQKMRVQLCKSVFSHTTASILINMCRSKKKSPDETLEMKPEEEDTGYLFHIVDNIFDSMNGEEKFTQKRINLDGEEEEYIYKTLIPTSGECPHKELWDEAIVLFENMKLVKNTPKAKERPNIVNNFVHTLKSFKLLRKKMKEHGFPSFSGRLFNQDPIENFFGQIRQHGARNTKPTTAAFKDYFKSLLVNSVVQNNVRSTNCEDSLSSGFLVNIQVNGAT